MDNEYAQAAQQFLNSENERIQRDGEKALQNVGRLLSIYYQSLLAGGCSINLAENIVRDYAMQFGPKAVSEGGGKGG